MAAERFAKRMERRQRRLRHDTARQPDGVDRDAAIQVKPGDRVKGGATVLALLPVAQQVAQSVSELAEAREREVHRS